MIKYILSTLAVVALGLNTAYANVIQSDQLPSELKYKNKPISPVCFGVTSYQEFKQEDGFVDLTKCIENVSQPQVINKDLADKGYYGFDVKDNTKEFTLSTHYYRAFNASPGFYFVESRSSGDDAGIFTTLDLVTRVNPTTLKIKTVVSGNQCMMGINSIDSSDGHFLMGINLTPYGLMTLADPDYKHSKVIEKLANCETCYIGKANYKVDIGGHKMLEYVSLEKPKEKDMSKLSCLDKLIAKQPSKEGKPVMITKEGLEKFNDDFKKECKS